MSLLRKCNTHSQPLASAGIGSRILLDGEAHGCYSLSVKCHAAFIYTEPMHILLYTLDRFKMT